MKIVNRKEFMKMPKGTVYSKFEPSEFYELYMKASGEDDEFYNEGQGRLNDWVCIPLINGFIKGSHDNCFDHQSVEHFEFDLDCSVRDGLYEAKQLFAIYEKEDILKLVARLTFSFLEADIE